MKPLSFLIVDDSSVFRVMLREVLNEISGIRIVGTAANGESALKQVEQLKPDIVTLDLNMPVMDGMTFLDQVKQVEKPPLVLVITSTSAAENALNALAKGAFEFINKPESGQEEDGPVYLRRQLGKVLRAAGARLGRLTDTGPPTRQVEPPSPRDLSIPKKVPRAVVIGISTGGPQALGVVIPRLPADLAVPVFVVQHMPPKYTRTLADRLDRESPIKVVEAQDGERARQGTVYLAPGGRQMGLGLDSNGFVVTRITDDPPENNCRPAVDYLLRSSVRIYNGAVLAVIMTGMGADGTLGARQIYRRGGRVIAQDRASCTVFGMPQEAIKAGVVDKIVALDKIADEIAVSWMR
ncbi:MAG: chemotaxis-specific protein-glutamate methyltransferase CheB [Acidobacteriota bacterium]|nr:chemotaxis-specific protein-glutamate methyltransferase CheB [Acidobacteriota bacterium]